MGEGGTVTRINGRIYLEVRTPRRVKALIKPTLDRPQPSDLQKKLRTFYERLRELRERGVAAGLRGGATEAGLFERNTQNQKILRAKFGADTTENLPQKELERCRVRGL